MHGYVVAMPLEIYCAYINISFFFFFFFLLFSGYEQKDKKVGEIGREEKKGYRGTDRWRQRMGENLYRSREKERG